MTRMSRSAMSRITCLPSVGAADADVVHASGPSESNRAWSLSMRS